MSADRWERASAPGRHIRMTRLVSLSLVLALFGACASDSSPELTAHCGAVELPVSGPSILPDQPLTDDAREAIASVQEVAAGEADFFDGYRWTVAEESNGAIRLFGSPIVEPPAGAPRYAYASFSRVDGEWRP
ncbi:MAG: hypothetical protein OEQ47_12615, partial [Acidimicrobiia bacterium]|nr:hypothetical protein [Acidimicrobiia bacterium]